MRNHTIRPWPASVVPETALPPHSSQQDAETPRKMKVERGRAAHVAHTCALNTIGCSHPQVARQQRWRRHLAASEAQYERFSSIVCAGHTSLHGSVGRVLRLCAGILGASDTLKAFLQQADSISDSDRHRIGHLDRRWSHSGGGHCG